MTLYDFHSRPSNILTAYISLLKFPTRSDNRLPILFAGYCCLKLKTPILLIISTALIFDSVIRLPVLSSYSSIVINSVAGLGDILNEVQFDFAIKCPTVVLLPQTSVPVTFIVPVGGEVELVALKTI